MSSEVLTRWQQAAERSSIRLPDHAPTWAELADRPSELVANVSLHTRHGAEDGHPLSQLLPAIQSLADVIEMPSLVAAAVDAHTIGTATRIEEHVKRKLRTRQPVHPLDENRIVACAVGPMDAELLDVLLGRAFTLAAGRGARELWLDLSGSFEVDGGLIEATLQNYPRHELAHRLQLVVCGVDEGRWSRRLQEMELTRWVRTGTLYNR